MGQTLDQSPSGTFRGFKAVESVDEGTQKIQQLGRRCQRSLVWYLGSLIPHCVSIRRAVDNLAPVPRITAEVSMNWPTGSRKNMPAPTRKSWRSEMPGLVNFDGTLARNVVSNRMKRVVRADNRRRSGVVIGRLHSDTKQLSSRIEKLHLMLVVGMVKMMMEWVRWWRVGCCGGAGVRWQVGGRHGRLVGQSVRPFPRMGMREISVECQ